MPEGDFAQTLSLFRASPYSSSGHGYTQEEKLTRYREFREVFLSSEAGRRVLREICVMGRMNNAIPSPAMNGTDMRYDATKVAEALGKRNLAVSILDTIMDEPKATPKEASRK